MAVSAVGAALRYDEPLHRRLRVGLVAIVVGVVLLAVSSGPEPPPTTSSPFRWALFAFALVALVVAAVTARRPTTSALDVGLLGATSGVLYGIGNTGLRVVPGFAPGQLVVNPAAWAAVIGGIGGLVALATALQRGSVAIAAGAVTVAETVVPAAIGLLVLGERPRPGFAAVAAVGFVAAVAGAVALCRDEALDPDDEPDEQTDPSSALGPPMPRTGGPPVVPH